MKKLLLLLALCAPAISPSVARAQAGDSDGDRDGFSPNRGDCDDTDDQVYPGAPELCDGKDNDCDGTADNPDDADGDGRHECNGDCDDDDPTVRSGFSESCDADGKDNDCNPSTLDTDLSRSCYDGPSGTRGVGQCRAGTEFCTGSGWPAAGTCPDDVTPDSEICNGIDDDCDRFTDEDFDQDGDGFADEDANCIGPGPFDCDDTNPNIKPGATELCDGVDQACDGDNDALLTRFCYTGPQGTLNKGICEGGTEQCDGTDWTGICAGQTLPVPNNANGEEANCDGLDDDCDGDVDEDYDLDDDGYVDESRVECASLPGDKDCDDTDRRVRPGRREECDNKDNDCDGTVDEGVTQACYDGPDGTRNRGICRDGRRECVAGDFVGPCVGEVTPEDTETCDELDNDCNGIVDDPFDLDRDGFVTDQEQECIDNVGGPLDCRDADPAVDPAAPITYPGAEERCDGIDNDCNPVTEDSDLTRACYTADPETLGEGVCEAGVQSCNGTEWNTSCVDEVTPTEETCNNLDDDCDDSVDEGFDEDEDGFTTCAEPTPDCDDTNPDVKPGAMEECDAIDNDCDGTIDGIEVDCYPEDEFPDTLDVGQCRAGKATCIDGEAQGECRNAITPVDETVRGCNGADDDCDGIADEDFDQDQDGVSTCASPQPDCDDDNPFRRPGIAERCDCEDNDCDELIDQIEVGGNIVDICEFGACHDFDGDGFTNCEGDCDDRNLNVNPGLPEICPDGLDNDCDGVVDEDVDEDGDFVTTCAGDCDDRFSTIRPDITEFCDGFDNNCNGQVDEGFDQDGDFVTICQGDCDDNDPNRNPFETEVCGDGIDNDCDGVIDPDFDADGDGFTSCGGDCNDYNAAVYPGAEEVCDGIINDCACDLEPRGRCLDFGFDVDEDGVTTCFGDCDDDNPAINPNARELADDGIDNNCNGQIDEGQDDADGDGFSFLCGDCDDGNDSVSPQTEDVCDGFDNDCDGLVDRTPWGALTCDTCNDVDEDGIQDCDGDCDDTDPEVFPGAPEACDGKDNDCNGTVDRDRVTGESVCTDAGVGPADGSSGADADAEGPGPDAGVATDAGASTDGGAELEDAAVEVGCGCHSSGPREPGALGEALLLLAAIAALTVLRRGRRSPIALALAVGLAAVACSNLDVGGVDPEDRDGGFADASRDGGSVDGGGFVDASSPDGGDAGAPDTGPLNEGPCRLLDPAPVRVVGLPGTTFRLAVHDELSELPIGGLDAIALDDPVRGLRGFALSFELSAAFDVADPGVAGVVIDQFLDPAFDDGVPGVIGVAAQIDETLRQRFSVGPHSAARTLRRVTMVNDVLVSRVRNGLLADLARVSLGDVTGLPTVEDEPVARSFVLQAMAVVDERDRRASFVVVAVESDRFEPASAVMTDLTNGTHIGESNEVLVTGCEDFVAQELAVDFIWVVDNSDSMQEEQLALVDAVETFFGALDDSQIDYRLGVITTDGETLRGGSFTTNIDAFRARVQVGISGEGNEAGLEYAMRAVDRARTTVNVDQRLRDEAVPVLIFFSDEDAVNLRPIEDYISFFADENVLPFAIVGPRPRGCIAVGRGAARLGASYIQVVEELAGSTASICSSSLDEPVREILVAAAGAASQTRLVDDPVSGSLEVQLATSTVARSRLDGFDYEPTANAILFFGDASQPPGTEFRVSYRRFQRLEN